MKLYIHFSENLLTNCNPGDIIVYIEVIQFILAQSSGRLAGISTQGVYTKMNINISNANGEAIYLQIVNQIKTLILEGKLKEGEMLPSMRNLAVELHISFMTTKRAYEELERDGFIESFTGKGSFVKAQNLELFREEQLKQIESLLMEAGEKARKAGITVQELHEMLDLVNGGE